MAEVKGMTLINQLAFIRETSGPEAVQRFQNALSPAARSYYDNPSPVEKVPIAVVQEAYQVINKLFGDGTPRIYREVGAFGARKDLPRLFKAMLNLATPSLVFKFLGTMWRQYYSSGQIKIVVDEKNHIVVHLVGFEDACEEICNDIAGFSQVLLEQLKIRNPQVRHTECSSINHDHCSFEGIWESVS